jgi:hypothetical protein
MWWAEPKACHPIFTVAIWQHRQRVHAAGSLSRRTRGRGQRTRREERIERLDRAKWEPPGPMIFCEAEPLRIWVEYSFPRMAPFLAREPNVI